MSNFQQRANFNLYNHAIDIEDSIEIVCVYFHAYFFFLKHVACATSVADIARLCSWLSAAPQGSINVQFTAGAYIYIGIVPYPPNTSVTVTCTNIPTGTTRVRNFYTKNCTHN